MNAIVHFSLFHKNEAALNKPRFNLAIRLGLVNITSQVEKALCESGIKEGLVTVNPNDIPANRHDLAIRSAFVSILSLEALNCGNAAHKLIELSTFSMARHQEIVQAL